MDEWIGAMGEMANPVFRLGFIYYFDCFVEIFLNILRVCTNIYYKSDFFAFIKHLHNTTFVEQTQQLTRW